MMEIRSILKLIFLKGQKVSLTVFMDSVEKEENDSIEF